MGIVSGNSSAKNFEMLLNKVDHPEKDNFQTYEHCVKADALRIQNLYWESIEEYLQALSFDENNVDALKGLGKSYKHVNYMKSAIEVLTKAKKIVPFDKEVYLELGICYYIDSKFSQAFKYLKRAIKIAPNYTEAQLHLAIAHEFANEIDLAIKVYNKIIEEKPSYVAAYNNLGGLYLRLNMCTAGVETFSSLLRINPEFARAFLGIAICYDKMDNTTLAIKYYKKYMQIKPNSDNIPYVLDRLKSMKEEQVVLNPTRPKHLKLVTSSRP